jgi:hypothetical protein
MTARLTVRHWLVDAVSCFGLAGVIRALIAVATVLGRRIAPGDERRPGERNAEVNCARVAVVTYETQTHVFHANALDTDTGLALPVAGTAPSTRTVEARTVIIPRTVVVSTFVAIVAGARYAHALF